MDYSEYFDDDYVNYDYWLLLDSWSKYQASNLFCGEEPKDKYKLNNRTDEMYEIITSGHLAKTLTPISEVKNLNLKERVEVFFRPQDIIKWAIKKGLHIPKELVNWYEQYKKQKNSKQVIEQLDIEREIYRLLAIENETLKKQLETNNQIQTDSNQEFIDDDLHPRKRNTLLKIIAVMAKDGYGNDLSVLYGDFAKEIEKAADSLKISLDFKTVGDKLKEARQFLPDSD